MRLKCPLCGDRDRREFYYYGAEDYLHRPAEVAPLPEWDNYLHLRDNPAGVVRDLWCPDGSSIINKTHIDWLFIDCGRNDGGYKAVPASGWCMAHPMATGEPHKVARRFRLHRFATGHLLDEEGTHAQHNLH